MELSSTVRKLSLIHRMISLKLARVEGGVMPVATVAASFHEHAKEFGVDMRSREKESKRSLETTIRPAVVNIWLAKLKGLHRCLHRYRRILRSTFGRFVT